MARNPSAKYWLRRSLKRFRSLAKKNKSSHTETAVTYALLRVLEAITEKLPDQTISEYIVNEILDILGLKGEEYDALTSLLIDRLSRHSPPENDNLEITEIISTLGLPEFPKGAPAANFAEEAYSLLKQKPLDKPLP